MPYPLGHWGFTSPCSNTEFIYKATIDVAQTLALVNNGPRGHCDSGRGGTAERDEVTDSDIGLGWKLHHWNRESVL